MSPAELLGFDVRPVAERSSKLTVQSYVNALEELNIHRWIRKLPGTVLIPSPDTTISQLGDEEKRLSDTLTEIVQTEEFLNRFIGLLELPAVSSIREPLIRHRNQVNAYLREAVKGIAELRDSYKERRDSSTRNRLTHMVERLMPMAEQIDKETDNLKALG